MSLHQKLSAIQSKISVPKARKNDFGKYKYRNCEDILEAVKPHLSGCSLTISDDIIMISDRIYVKATATFSNAESSISATAYAREDDSKKGMDLSQLTGSCSSYARKYALNGLFLIDDNHDADAMDNREIKPKKQVNVKAILDKIKSSKNLNELKSNYVAGHQEAKGSGFENEIIKAKDEMKFELEKNDASVMTLKKALHLIESETSREALALLSTSLYKTFENDDKAIGEISGAIDMKKEELLK